MLASPFKIGLPAHSLYPEHLYFYSAGGRGKHIKRKGKEKGLQLSRFLFMWLRSQRTEQLYEYSHFCKIVCFCIQHYISFDFTLMLLDLLEISNVNCDEIISLCQSGHYQWHFKLIFPLWEGIAKSKESGLWRAEKWQDADWGFDWSMSLKSTAVQNRIDSLSPCKATCWDQLPILS